MRTELAHYQYRGARALVLLHDKELREFLAVWRRARTANLALPATSDPDYASLEALLFHVLRAARGYMTWMCESLGLADPGIEAPPPVERVAAGSIAAARATVFGLLFRNSEQGSEQTFMPDGKRASENRGPFL